MIVASGEVNASIPGTYLLFYNYTDAAGNAAQAGANSSCGGYNRSGYQHGDGNITHQAGMFTLMPMPVGAMLWMDRV